MRRICYVSGSRADFGLIERTLRRAQADPRLDISICVTGQHLAPGFGDTVREIEASGLRICAHVPVSLDGSTGAMMARAIGHETVGLVDALERERPDLAMVLGDRGEMLAGAIAAIHLNIPIVHVHGGERSGTVDEPVRHAISKLAHYHLVTTPCARERLIRMGEAASNIHVTGAPGLDGIVEAARTSREELCADLSLAAARPIALVVFHPVIQEADIAGEQMDAILSAVIEADYQALCLAPNSDAGGLQIRRSIRRRLDAHALRLVEHMDRAQYLSWMAAADVMIGNSSSGIIEAATLGIPVVNIGSRQRWRERSGNVVDVPPIVGDIRRAIEALAAAGRGPWENVYGDGRAGERIVTLLATLPLIPQVLHKHNTY
jgi:GDP/UDP-N,N'-diacetylbacillosamine 2-epimerase (hydrolysing)